MIAWKQMDSHAVLFWRRSNWNSFETQGGRHAALIVTLFLMIRNLTLRFGRTPNSAPTPIELGPVTVFVGPNNSGKSRVLRELHQLCVDGRGEPPGVIISSIEFESLTAEQSVAKVDELFVRQASDADPNEIIIRRANSTLKVSRSRLTTALQQPNDGNQRHRFASMYMGGVTLLLDGASRISLVQDKPAGDLQSESRDNSFQVLFHNDQVRSEVRRIIFDAFNTHFVLDPTSLGTFRIRLSDVPPQNDLQERGIHAEAVAFHAAAKPVQEASDGVKAFTGIITEVSAGNPQVLLIDEPEAFLHPPLAFKLGLELSRTAAGTNKRVFVSTHSSSFVMGCIQSGTPINIIRLTYRGGVSTARVLPNNELLELMRNPLLRSTGVLNGLFHEFVVVTESDTDRAFYQEVNERLLRFDPPRGIPNCLFLHAQNKQTVPTLLKPLRDLGIPAAGLVDIDAIKDGGGVWTNLLRGAHIPEASYGALAAHRAAVRQAFDATGSDMKRDGGIELLTGQERESAEDLLEQLANYGIFLVPRGELESWLPAVNAAGHGPAWLIEKFEQMGSDPDAEGYVIPGQNDVWDFINNVRIWLANPNRRGIPD